MTELFLGTLVLTQTTSKYGLFGEDLFMDFSKSVGSSNSGEIIWNNLRIKYESEAGYVLM